MNEILIPSAVLLFLIIVFVFPFVLTLSKKKHLNFLESDIDGNLDIKEDDKKIFNFVKILKNDEGVQTGLEFAANDDVLATYVTIYYTIKKKTYFKKYRLNFLKDRTIFLPLKKGFEEVNYFINQVNDEPYKDKFNLRLTKAKFLTFVIFEWILSLALIGIIIGIIFFNYQLLITQFPVYGMIIGIVGGVLGIALFPAIYFATFFGFEKYIYGGKLND